MSNSQRIRVSGQAFALLLALANTSVIAETPDRYLYRDGSCVNLHVSSSGEGGETAMALTAAPLVRNGKLRALAITTARRAQAFPELPSIAESGVPGYDIASWNGVFAPAGTPPAIIQIINRDVLVVTNTPDMKEKVSADAAEIAPPNTPGEFGALLAREIAMWQKFVRSTGIRIE